MPTPAQWPPSGIGAITASSNLGELMIYEIFAGYQGWSRRRRPRGPWADGWEQAAESRIPSTNDIPSGVSEPEPARVWMASRVSARHRASGFAAA